MDHEEKSMDTAPPGLSNAIDRILAHPELISMVASALGAGATQNAEKPQTGSADAGAPTASTSVPAAAPPSDTAPPSASESAATPTKASTPDGLPDLMTSLAPLLSGLNGGIKEGISKPKDDNRTCLLRALKPYVSPGRREAIDYMIRLSQITDVLKHLY